MDEELCVVDSGTTNSILRETKYFQTLTKKYFQKSFPDPTPDSDR